MKVSSKSPQFNENKLNNYLHLIKKNMPVSNILVEKQDVDQIKKYYSTNYFAYLIFHNKKGFMHMGISKDGTYKEEDLLEPLNIINSYIKKIEAKRVLEIGSGNGSNSSYLAKLNKEVNFVGLDLSKKPFLKFKRITNYSQDSGNYHDLSKLPDDSFDIVFAIETLCHSSNKTRVLNEVYKKLNKGGLFIVFDGYLSKPLSKLTSEEKLAKQLTEKAMAVEDFENIIDFERIIKHSQFQAIKQEDLSLFVLPTMQRFEKTALLFYRFSPITKFLRAVLPLDMMKNSIAGLLMPTLIQKGIACYHLHILKKV